MPFQICFNFVYLLWGIRTRFNYYRDAVPGNSMTWCKSNEPWRDFFFFGFFLRLHWLQKGSFLVLIGTFFLLLNFSFNSCQQKKKKKILKFLFIDFQLFDYLTEFLKFSCWKFIKSWQTSGFIGGRRPTETGFFIYVLTRHKNWFIAFPFLLLPDFFSCAV